MENIIKIADSVLESLKNAGADNASCIVKTGNTTELSVESMELTQLRSVSDKTTIVMQAFVGNKKASAQIGSSEIEHIIKAATDCVNIAKSGKDDKDYGMNESGEVTNVQASTAKLEQEKLISYTSDFVKDVEREFPLINLRRVTVNHVESTSVYKNSYGTSIVNPSSHYDFGAHFLAAENKEMSSYTSAGFSFKNFDKPFIEHPATKEMLSNATKQIHTVPFGKKEKGVLIIAPSCLAGIFRQMMEAFMGSSTLVSKTSRWQEMIGKQVALEALSLSSEPNNPNIVTGEGFTDEGFATENIQIIENGKLLTLMPNLYTSKKTGLAMAKSNGSNLVAKGGNTPLEEMIKGIETGILMYRYSGGNMLSSGDFSGIAKNSFIIENGKIVSAARETTVSGNISDMIMNIKGVSGEVVSNGSYVMPYMAFDGVTIS